MTNQGIRFSKEVNEFIHASGHPLRNEIDLLRTIIFSAEPGIAEDIKWNSPNYSLNGKDRITMRIQPPKQIQLIFHRGAKVLEQPKEKLIDDASGLLTWKTNDRAIATFKNKDGIASAAPFLKQIIRKWLKASGID